MNKSIIIQELYQEMKLFHLMLSSICQLISFIEKIQNSLRLLLMLLLQIFCRAITIIVITALILIDFLIFLINSLRDFLKLPYSLNNIIKQLQLLSRILKIKIAETELVIHEEILQSVLIDFSWIWCGYPFVKEHLSGISYLINYR